MLNGDTNLYKLATSNQDSRKKKSSQAKNDGDDKPSKKCYIGLQYQTIIGQFKLIVPWKRNSELADNKTNVLAR